MALLNRGFVRSADGEDVGSWQVIGLEHATDWEHLLAPCERDEYGALSRSEHRMEWMGARLAVKSILLDRCLIASPLECQIRKDRFGCPRAVISGERSKTTAQCSLTHRMGSSAACVTWRSGLNPGIDLEVISERPWRLRKSFLNERDSAQDFMDGLDLCTVMWACKEAAAKSLGLGLMIDFRELTVLMDAEGRFSVSYQDASSIRGRAFRYGDFMLAVCVYDGQYDCRPDQSL